MKYLLSFFSILFTFLLTPTIAYGPYEVQEFEYYVSQSPIRVSYSSFTFYDPTSKIKTYCKYKAARGYGYDIPGPTPSDFYPCENKDVKWKYEESGQVLYVEFGYYQPNTYTGESDWVRILANGTMVPNGCAPYGKYGYKCTPRETRYLTVLVAVI
ncbi:hypothetical protein ABW19_dt0209558 [Dactylella cylindrospora]|nr:hypothetical protein ABW19_dt0209558 [Dactylella cylindrospora]